MRRTRHWVYIYSIPTTSDALGCIVDVYKTGTDDKAALKYRDIYNYPHIFRVRGDNLPSRTWVTTNFHLGEGA